MIPKCNQCGGSLVEQVSADALIPVLECDQCGRQVPRGAFGQQERLLPGLEPEQVIEKAESEHGPFIARVCLFSGGNDSTVLAHRCRDHYEQLVFIDTGTAVPGVREFVQEFAEYLDKPLLVYESGDEYRRMVLGGGMRSNGKPNVAMGFPGPAQHGRAYNRLKERQLEALRRDLKDGHPRSARVLYLTGVRRDESKRRAQRSEVTRKGAMTFCNPLIDWTNLQMQAYRSEHRLPQSDVAALIHRSGECNCGAFAAPGEREMMQSLWPEWFERTIGDLEREAKSMGLRACVWGQAPPSMPADEVGELCSDCQLRMTVGEAA